jgi:predicted cupin superfamily sugar epimerase
VSYGLGNVTFIPTLVDPQFWDFEDFELKKSSPELQVAQELERLKEPISKRLRNSVAPGIKL